LLTIDLCRKKGDRYVATPGGQNLATYDNSERARIRAALILYMQENRIGVPELHNRITTAARNPEAFSLKTLQRFLADKMRVNDDAVGHCATFAARLPGQRAQAHRLADALYEFYAKEPDLIGGVYTVSTADAVISEITIQFPPNSRTSYIVTERSTGTLARVHDGALVFTRTGILAVLKDRLMRSARVHTLHLNRESNTFYGVLYDDGPLARGTVPYQLLQTTLQRIENAE
jgi:hypothetical protein